MDIISFFITLDNMCIIVYSSRSCSFNSKPWKGKSMILMTRRFWVFQTHTQMIRFTLLVIAGFLGLTLGMDQHYNGTRAEPPTTPPVAPSPAPIHVPVPPSHPKVDWYEFLHPKPTTSPPPSAPPTKVKRPRHPRHHRGPKQIA